MDEFPVTSQLPALQVTPTGKVKLRAFPTDQALSSFVSALISENDRRATVNGRIAKKLDSEQPHDPAVLKQAGLSWKSNFSSRPLNTLVQRVAGRLPRAVSTARYLTSSALPADVPGSRAKTEFFRTEFTSFLRAEPRFAPFVEQVSLENTLFGYLACAWLNEEDWFPSFFRQDSFFAPDGVSQTSAEANAVVFRQELIPTAAFEVLEAAKDVENGHWDIEKFADAINRATPDVNKAPGQAEFARKFADLQRNLSQSSTFVGGKYVVMYHVLAQELTGKVSHYILDDAKNVLFKHEDRFENMASSVVFITFEPANGKLHGSKGVGRIAYQMAGVVDRSRNDAVDRLALAGKMIISAPSGQLSKFMLNVIGSTIVIGDEFEVSNVKIDSDPEASITLDRYLTDMLDDMAGNVRPPSMTRELVTAKEIALIQGREDERSDDALQRWLRQLGEVISGIQYRVLAPGNVSEPVKRLIARLRTRLTDEEISWLRGTPSLTTVAAWTDTERQSIVVAAVEGRGNPLYNQRELESAKLTAQVGPELAEQLLIAANDPTITAEQTRGQMLENDLMMNGQPVPVSPRDNHEIHLQTLLPVVQHAVTEAMDNPTAEAVVAAMMQHAHEHVALAEQQGVVSQTVEQTKKLLAQLDSAMTQLAEAKQAAEQEMSADPNADPNAVPVDPIQQIPTYASIPAEPPVV